MKGNLKIVLILVIILCTLTFSISGFKSGNNDSEEYSFKIYFFNAGKADCILISNNDKYIMIDTGEEELTSEILNYFKSHNITKLDYLIVTHFDKDHVGSAANIINNIEIDNVMQSNVPKESTYYSNYINALQEKNITPQTVSGDISFVLEDMNVTVNGPTNIYDDNDSNNSSLIVSLNYKNTNYLFMGDSQNSRIKDFLKINNAKYDFIKIPYHGNYQKQLDNLLEETEPKYAVITCSNEEPDTSDTEKLLKSLNINYYLTKNGSITITSDGNTILINSK